MNNTDKHKTYYIYTAIAIIVVVASACVWLGTTDTPVDSGVSATSTVLLPPIPPGPGMQSYIDQVLGFSFAYPIGFAVDGQGDASDRTVIISSSTTGQAFQLETKSWNDPDHTVTVERIRHDAPTLDVRDPEPLTVHGQVRGVSFRSIVSGVPGDVIQIWFIMNSRLYQFTAPISSSALVEDALSTFNP